jgi:hypothetical protein
MCTNMPQYSLQLFLITTGYFALHPYLHGYNFFFGVAELTNVPLTVYDVFKYQKSIGWQTKYSALFQITQVSFALSFVAIRLVWWPMVSYPFWLESVAALKGETNAHSPFVIGFFLLSNVFLTFLQFFWGVQIVQGALGLGADKSTSKKSNDSANPAVPALAEGRDPERVTRASARKSARK